MVNIQLRFGRYVGQIDYANSLVWIHDDVNVTSIVQSTATSAINPEQAPFGDRRLVVPGS